VADFDPRPTAAATLRQIAGWGVYDCGGESWQKEFYGLAKQVETLDPEEVGCPMCEEVTCDEDCPLHGFRKIDKEEGTANPPH